MPRKSNYNTKQIQELLSYMKSTAGSHVTVSDICRHFEEADIKIGMTTVYRNLDRLVEQGLVAKYTIDSASSACYEYLGGHEDNHDCSDCYHCKCELCGKIIHLECEDVARLGAHIMEHHGFAVDYHRTVFYGICADCRRKE